MFFTLNFELDFGQPLKLIAAAKPYVKKTMCSDGLYTLTLTLPLGVGWYTRHHVFKHLDKEFMKCSCHASVLEVRIKFHAPCEVCIYVMNKYIKATSTRVYKLLLRISASCLELRC